MRKSISMVLDIKELTTKLKSKIKVDELSECHEWQGSRNYDGYGQISHERRTWAAHRVSYELHYGPISQNDEAWWVLHKCDNPCCCNPDHLFKGSPKDNAIDCADKKRKRVGYRTVSAFYGRKQDSNKKCGTVFYEYKGEIKQLSEWSEIFGLNQTTLWQRFDAGWPEDDIPMSPKEYKRHLRADCKTFYRRFSGKQEVIDYLLTKQSPNCSNS